MSFKLSVRRTPSVGQQSLVIVSDEQRMSEMRKFLPILHLAGIEVDYVGSRPNGSELEGHTSVPYSNCIFGGALVQRLRDLESEIERLSDDPEALAVNEHLMLPASEFPVLSMAPLSAWYDVIDNSGNIRDPETGYSKIVIKMDNSEILLKLPELEVCRTRSNLLKEGKWPGLTMPRPSTVSGGDNDAITEHKTVKVTVERVAVMIVSSGNAIELPHSIDVATIKPGITINVSDDHCIQRKYFDRRHASDISIQDSLF